MQIMQKLCNIYRYICILYDLCKKTLRERESKFCKKFCQENKFKNFIILSNKFIDINLYIIWLFNNQFIFGCLCG